MTLEEVEIPAEDLLRRIETMTQGIYPLGPHGWPNVILDWRTRKPDHKLLFVVRLQETRLKPFSMFVVINGERYVVGGELNRMKPIEVNSENLLQHLAWAEQVIVSFTPIRGLTSGP